MEAAHRIIKALMVMPDKAARFIEPDWFLPEELFEENGNIRVADEYIVDIMFKASGETYASLLPYAQTIIFDGVPIVTLDLEGLLKTKQTSRDKDISDRHILERALEALRAGRNLRP
jgi:hypothetical protein